MKSQKFWGGLLLAVAMTMIVSGCGKKVVNNTDNTIANTLDNSNSLTNFTPFPGTNSTSDSGLADPEAMLPELKQETQTAISLIKQVKMVQQAKVEPELVLVSSKYVDSLSSAYGLVTNFYVFKISSQPDYYFLVDMPRNGNPKKRFITPVEDFNLDFDILKIPGDYWKISSIKAMQLVETAGGTAFRSSHKKFEVSVILAQPAGQYLSWFITYQANDGSGAKTQWQVDAKTGAVQEVKV